MDQTPRSLPHRLCVAPMMECTDRHDRYFLRLLTRHAWLYTEMISTGALLHGDTERLLEFHPAEHPVAIQLGGSDPDELAECGRLAVRCGYDEINLNIGCPSERVKRGRFGACLMLEPELVADCVRALRDAVTVPVTVKTRLGVDARDSYEGLARFVEIVSAAGCRTFLIHARKAWLAGLSPKQNRELPPLRYDRVHRLKCDMPEIEIVLNGGLRSLEEASRHLDQVDGVMIGREVYRNPYLLANADARVFADHHPIRTRHETVEAMLPYIEGELDRGVLLSRITRHLLGLFRGTPGAKAWRRHLSERAWRPGAGLEVIEAALARVPRDQYPRGLQPAAAPEETRPTPAVFA